MFAAVDDSQARQRGRRLFSHIFVSPPRTGVGWIVHEPSAITKLRLRHDHPAAPIERDGKLVSQSALASSAHSIGRPLAIDRSCIAKFLSTTPTGNHFPVSLLLQTDTVIK